MSGVAVLQADESGVAVLQIVVTRTRGGCYLIPTPDGLNFASAAAEIASRNVSVPTSTPRHLAFCSHTSLSASTLRFLHPHLAFCIHTSHPHFAFCIHTSLSASTPRFLHPHLASTLRFLQPHFAFCIYTSLSAATLRFLHAPTVCFLHPHFTSASTPRRKCSLMN